VRFIVSAITACLAIACLAEGEAEAGAWTLAEGSGQLIMTTGRKIAPVGAFMGGPADSDANSSQIWAEYGVADGWTVGVVAYGEFSTTDAEDMELRLGGHVRHRVWTGSAGDVASVQAGLGVPVEGWLGDLAPDSLPDSVPEVHLRGLYGRGWQTGWGNSFVSAEAGFHWRGERAADELRLDVTAGHEAWKGVLGLFSIFAAVPIGGGDGGEGNRDDGSDATLKLAPSVAYTLWPWLGDNDKKPFDPIHPNTIQLGIVWDALNPDDGLGVQLSIWKSF
jgi:hypothetical protein